MPLHIGDYLADTIHLTTEEHGMYLMLIMHYWRHGPIDDTPENLISITHISRKKGRLISLNKVRSFFLNKNGKLYHKRIDSERNMCLEQREKYKNRARTAATKRWNQACYKHATSNATSNAQAIDKHGNIHSTYLYSSLNLAIDPEVQVCARAKRVKKTPISDDCLQPVDKIPAPIWGDCKYFRMDKNGFTEIQNWFKKNNLDEKILTAAIEEIDLWLTEATTQTAKKAQKQADHHNRLRAGWVLDNVRKKFPALFRPVKPAPNEHRQFDKPKTITEKNKEFFDRIERKQQQTQEPNIDESTTDNAAIEVNFKHLA